MPNAVFIIWIILLVVTVLILPYLIYLLHKTWKAARSIEIYFNEMLKAGVGIANNTGHIKALDDTITVAGDMLNTAGKINEHTETIEKTFHQRAAKLN